MRETVQSSESSKALKFQELEPQFKTYQPSISYTFKQAISTIKLWIGWQFLMLQ